MKDYSGISRTVQITLLVLAGESIFILPFVLPRIFRPTYLSSLDINNTEIGTCFSVYGTVALISYLFGGTLADKFSERKLMGTALILTSLGGFYIYTTPNYTGLLFLYGYWGFTSIFMFWAAMLKATAIWGGNNSQGKAFGILDGGRGLVGASFGLLGVLVFSMLIPEESAEDPEVLLHAFKRVLIISSIIVLGVGMLVLVLMKDSKEGVSQNISIKDVLSVLEYKFLWWIMIIIFCGYLGYKSTDFLPQYANEILGYNEEEAAQLGTVLLYLRPLTGISIGFIADKKGVSNLLLLSFTGTLIGAVTIPLSELLSMSILFIASIGLFGAGVYAIRAIYFAALREGKIPYHLMGTAIGIVSIIGYLPDVFYGPYTGHLLDNYPINYGFQMIFATVSFFALIGIIASFRLKKLIND
ncbi:MAG: MFS transporter [Crocinitomicaceae bacterium]|nr:MFS transporter [Crocinitomicaceae bacterium]